MYEVKILTHFAAAHGLRNFHGKCEALHGHNWKVEVTVRGAELDKAGMLVDFALLKKLTDRVMEELDHKHLNELDPFAELSPSSENIARYIWDRLTEMMDAPGAELVRVDCWESETSRASYLGPVTD